MAVLGNNTIGANLAFIGDDGYATKFTPTENGTIDELLCYLEEINGDSGDLASVAIYSDNAGTPDSLLAYATSSMSVSSIGAWITFAMTENVAGGLNITNGVPVWFAIATNYATSVRGYYDNGDVAQLNIGGSSITSLVFPSTWSASGTYVDFTSSIYANYTPESAVNTGAFFQFF